VAAGQASWLVLGSTWSASLQLCGASLWAQVLLSGLWPLGATRRGIALCLCLGRSGASSATSGPSWWSSFWRARSAGRKLRPPVALGQSRHTPLVSAIGLSTDGPKEQGRDTSFEIRGPRPAASGGRRAASGERATTRGA